MPSITQIEPVYLDGFATMPLAPEARAAMIAAFDQVGNAGSSHSAGEAAAQRIAQARLAVADLINAAPTEITGFTWSPGVWYQINTRVDVSKGTWDFYVNGNHYDAPDPLGFRGNAVALDRFRFLSEGTGNVYLDGLTISAIPEPSSFIYSGLVGFAGMVYVLFRKRFAIAKSCV